MAKFGKIRRSFASTLGEEIDESIKANSVYGSDSDENAAIEIAYFFEPEEIVG